MNANSTRPSASRMNGAKRFACVWFLSLLLVADAFAQVNSSVSQAKDLLSLTPSVDLPLGTLQSDAESPSRQGRQSGRIVSPTPPVQIIDKPSSSGGAPSLRFSTTVETRIDSRGSGEKATGSGVETPQYGAVPQAPIPLRFEFEDFVEQSLGTRIARFGDAAFASPTAFVTPDQLPLPTAYVVRAGDEIATRAWGQIDIEHVGIVDRLGQLYIPRVGTLTVAGLRRDQLDGVVRNALQKQFKNFELSTSVGATQPVLIHITGAAKKPGSVTLPAQSTLLTAAFHSGGVLERANLRRVQLRRGGETVAEIDLYDFLAFGSNRSDVPIRNGDIVHFPIADGFAAVGGSVNVPAVFQLKAGMTVAQLLALAGGVSTTGKAGQAVVERIVAHRERTIEIVVLDSIGLARAVQDGELFTFVPISPRIENTVTLSGFVALPLRVAYREGMRVSDLIPNADALVPPVYWAARNQQSTLNRLSDRRAPEIRRDMPEINWDYAVVERIDRRSTSPKLLPFNLELAVNKRDPQNDLLLAAGDTITIFSKADFRIRAEQRTRYVKVEGEVLNAGMYSVAHGTSLRQLITRAGGMSGEAYVYGIELTRESTRQFQQARMNEAVDQLEQEFQRHFATRARNLTSQEEALAAPSEAESLKTLIAKLRTAKASGRIVLELSPQDASTDRLPDLAMEDGDSVYIPAVPATIGVVGAVAREGTYLYGSNKRLSDYLRQAGGAARYGDLDRLHLLRADGTVLSGEPGILGKRMDLTMALAPGDTVIVPESPDRVSLTRAIKDWTQILYQFGLGAAGIRILRGF